MAWIRTLKFTVSWSLDNLITYTFAFVCLSVCFLQDSQSYICFLFVDLLACFCSHSGNVPC